jgi:hypothetical protein
MFAHEGKGAAMVDIQSFLKFVFSALFVLFGQYSFSLREEAQESEATIAQTEPARQEQPGRFAAFIEQVMNGMRAQ